MRYLLVTCTLVMMWTGSAQAGVIGTVSLEGIDYNLETVIGSYDDLSAVLEAQPWFGDASLAGELAGLAGLNLVGIFSSHNSSTIGTTLSSFFAVGINNGLPDIVIWSLVNSTVRQVNLRRGDSVSVEWVVLGLALDEGSSSVPSPPAIMLAMLGLLGLRFSQRNKA